MPNIQSAWKVRFKVLLSLILVCLVSVWLFGEAAQWLLRWRAEKLLADIRSITVGQTSVDNARRLLERPSRESFRPISCDDRGCQYTVIVRHNLPEVLIGRYDKRYWIPYVVAFFGLRNSGAIAGFTASNGIVTQKWYGLNVGLPPSDWFDRGGAYTPDLLVSSSGSTELPAYEQSILPPGQYHHVRNFKGTYGVVVSFDRREAAAEQNALMDFRLDCVTRLIACRDESDILSEGKRLLLERDAAWQSRGR